jgi:hypothetical protein
VRATTYFGRCFPHVDGVFDLKNEKRRKEKKVEKEEKRPGANM